MDENELKHAIKHCIENNCIGCMYRDDILCVNRLMSAAENYITELDERLAITQESMEALEQRCDVLEKRLKDPDRIKVTRCKDCRFFEPCNVEEGDNSGHCRNDYAPCQNQTVDAWWFCGSAERG